MEPTSGQVVGALLLFLGLILAMPVLIERRATRIKSVGYPAKGRVISTKYHAGTEYQPSG